MFLYRLLLSRRRKYWNGQTCCDYAQSTQSCLPAVSYGRDLANVKVAEYYVYDLFQLPYEGNIKLMVNQSIFHPVRDTRSKNGQYSSNKGC